MYEHLRNDTETFRKELKPYISSLYMGILDRHNLARLYDYIDIYKSYENTLLQLEPDLQTGVFALEQSFKNLEDKTISPRIRADILNQIPNFRTGLLDNLKNLEELASNSKRLLSAWNARKSDRVLAYLGRQFEFTSLFHEPIIAPSDEYNSYVFYVSASYIPATSSMGYSGVGIDTKPSPVNVAFKVAEGGAASILLAGSKMVSRATAAVALAALLVVDFAYNGHKLGVHERKVKELIEEEYRVVNQIRNDISKDQKTFITESIDKVLSDHAFDGASFSSKIEQLIADIEVFSHSLRKKVNAFKFQYASQYAAFEKDLEQLANANTKEITDGIMQQRADDIQTMRDFDAEASAFIAQNGQNILHSIQPNAMRTSNSNDYGALETVFKMDALFAEKYLKTSLFRKKHDFFTNDPLFYSSAYPVGEWLAFLTRFLDRARY